MPSRCTLSRIDVTPRAGGHGHHEVSASLRSRKRRLLGRSRDHGPYPDQLTLPDGSTVRIHQEGQFTLNANGVPVVTRATATFG